MQHSIEFSIFLIFTSAAIFATVALYARQAMNTDRMWMPSVQPRTFALLAHPGGVWRLFAFRESSLTRVNISTHESWWIFVGIVFLIGGWLLLVCCSILAAGCLLLAADCFLTNRWVVLISPSSIGLVLLSFLYGLTSKPRIYQNA